MNWKTSFSCHHFHHCSQSVMTDYLFEYQGPNESVDNKVYNRRLFGKILLATYLDIELQNFYVETVTRFFINVSDKPQTKKCYYLTDSRWSLPIIYFVTFLDAVNHLVHHYDFWIRAQQKCNRLLTIGM